MFKAVKKEVLLYIYLGILCLSVGFGIYSARWAEKRNAAVSLNIAGGVSEKIILIDAGHGGADAGASANGISEKDINLRVAQKLKAHIEEKGGKVIMTREEDCSTADGTEKGSWKVADLKKRKSMADSGEANIFISIHMNKFPQEKYKGAQVFYSGDNEESRILGEEIQRIFPEILQDGNKREAKKSDGSIYVLKNAKIPSVVVECGFISNKEEAENLKNEEYQNRLAEAICIGIERYYNK